jgi:hypothetical protein
MKSCVLPEYRSPINAIAFWPVDFLRPRNRYIKKLTMRRPIIVGINAPVPDYYDVDWMRV